MKNGSNLINQEVQSIESTRQSASEPDSANRLYNVRGERLTATELLWKRMTELYGHKWTSANGSVPTEGWEAVCLGLTVENIKRGLNRMVELYQTWPPGAIEFRQLCLPRSEDIGLPTMREAFDQLVGLNTNKHPSVIWLLRQIRHEGLAFRLRRMDENKAIDEWEKAWSEVVDHVLKGGELPEPENQIEQVFAKASPEFARAELDKIKGLFA